MMRDVILWKRLNPRSFAPSRGAQSRRRYDCETSQNTTKTIDDNLLSANLKIPKMLEKSLSK